MRLRTKLMALGTGVTLLAVTGAASAACWHRLGHRSPRPIRPQAARW